MIDCRSSFQMMLAGWKSPWQSWHPLGAFYPPPHPLPKVGKIGRRLRFVHLGVQPAEDARAREDQPRLLADECKHVRPIDALHDQAGPAIDGLRATHLRHVDAGGARRLHRVRLPLDGLPGVRAAHQPQHAAVLPGEDLRLAALGDFLQVGHGRDFRQVKVRFANRPYLSPSRASSASVAWAAARRAIGTRKGEQLT